MSQLQDALSYVLEQAQAAGAEADAIISRGNQFSLKADGGELAEYKVTSSQVLGIRVIKDDQAGTSYSESLEQASLTQMVEQALTNARFSKADAHEQIAAVDNQLSTPTEEIFQPDTTSVEEKIALALELEAGLTRQPRPTTAPYNGFAEGESETLLANTRGTLCHHQSRQFQCYTSALINQDGKQSMHLAVQTGRRFEELSAATCVADAYEMAEALLDGEPVATGNYPVIFDTNSLSDLFGAFGLCLSGSSAMKGINPWREQLGQAVASPLLTLSDKPYVQGGSDISAFDSEGFATQETLLLGEGQLHSLLHNSVTASYFGIDNTANGARSAKGGLGVASNHLVIAAGQHSEAELTGGEYLELVDLQGVHSGADGISGDFSFGASGFLCRDGQRVQPVRGITVAGNFYQMLKAVDAVGQLVLPDNSHSFYAPKIRFSQLSIAGS